jgi:hypothetical protein
MSEPQQSDRNDFKIAQSSILQIEYDDIVASTSRNLRRQESRDNVIAGEVRIADDEFNFFF